MKKKIFFSGILSFLMIAPFFTLQSCSCQSRLQRLMRHCPECFLQDTLSHNDTLLPPPIPIFGHLSWYELNQPGPVALHGANYALDITLDDTGLTIDGTVTPDTIIRTIRIPVDRPVIVEKSAKPPLYQYLLLVVLALFALWGLSFTLKNRHK